MTYNPATDFVGVYRAVAGGVQKGEVPGLDLVVAALGRANLINVSVSNIAPVANQAVTAWFQPATPSYSAEGGLSLWNAAGAAYVAATPRLLLEMLAAAEKVAAVPTAISSLLDTLGVVHGDVAFRGAANWQALAPGTAGFALTSGGAGADPIWAAFGGVVTVKKQVFTGTGVYTPSVGMLFAQIECVGGGGGSGGLPANGAGNAQGGGGGGGGGYSRFLATAAVIGVSKAVTIGAGGTAGASAGPTAGGVGGDTSVGVLCIGKGGSGAPAGAGTIVPLLGGAGGVAGTGDFTVQGSDGGPGGAQNSVATSTLTAGAGGAGPFGGSAPGQILNAVVAGVAGKGYGNGASGGITWNNAAANGAAGAPGVVYITEYCSQ